MDSDDEDSFFTKGAGRGSRGTNNASAGPSRTRRSAAASALPDEDADPTDIDIDLFASESHLELETDETPLQQLIRHWMNERHAPDILPAKQELLAGLLDHIRRQSDTIQTLRADPSSSEEDHFRIMLVQTEIERVKFIVRSYVRTRLFKIEKYARHITLNVDLQSRLSATERAHAARYANIVDDHLDLSVLQSLPEAQRTLDDAPAFVPAMIPEPDKTHAVFVHARADCPPVRVPDGSYLEMKKGHIALTPYLVVEQLIARGDVELV